jgi:hypothetical protein
LKFYSPLQDNQCLLYGSDAFTQSEDVLVLVFTVHLYHAAPSAAPSAASSDKYPQLFSDEQQKPTPNGSKTRAFTEEEYMISDIEFLKEVCERMQQVGLVQSKAEFSAMLLGKGPSYLTSMSARDRKVPDEVMTHLIARLQACIIEDDTALARLADAVARREHDRKHCADMLEWVTRHRALEVAQEPPQQARHTPSILKGIARWWSQGQAMMPWTNRNARTGLQ